MSFYPFLQRYESDVNHQIINERNRDIQLLQSELEQLYEIQCDLGLMVHTQGETIDLIEQHVETSEINVNEGVKHLEKAETYQKSSRRKQLLLGGILTATGATIGGGLLIMLSPIAGAVTIGVGVVTGVSCIAISFIKPKPVK